MDRLDRVTGRHRARPTWRDVVRQKLVPGIAMAGVLVVLSYALAGLIAHADTGAATYGEQHWRPICSLLDGHASIDGVRATLHRVMWVSGFDEHQAGEAVGAAVYHHCSQHQPLLQQFVIHEMAIA